MDSLAEIVTVICIAAIAIAAAYFTPEFAKEIELTAIAGLAGYVSGNARGKRKILS